MYKAVIFDMDGTILDTLEDLTDSVNHTMEVMGMPKHTLEEVRSYVGNGLHKTIERAVPVGCTGEDIEKAYIIMVEYYRNHCNIKTRPYDGICELIRDIRKKGIKTAVISNKNDKAVKALCDELFEDCFDFSLGDTKGIPLKPDRAMVDITMEALSVKSDEAIYIGDSEVDIMTAHNSDMKCISVTWGFRDKVLLLEKGADILVDNIAEILEILEL
ncbi:MAG: HAD-IA family hydrolase [Lachnospiraceae bacterium]|nr:HAD-IA family hydrolase [Candidatus Colinaster scatohippi]